MVLFGVEMLADPSLLDMHDPTIGRLVLCSLAKGILSQNFTVRDFIPRDLLSWFWACSLRMCLFFTAFVLA